MRCLLSIKFDFFISTGYTALMIIHDSLDNVPAVFKNAVVAMGNFDGVHRGHQAVIGDAHLHAEKLGVHLIVLTLSPHPKLYFNPHAPPFIITPLAHKIPHFSALGVKGVFALKFADIKDYTAKQFIDKILVDTLQVSIVSVGYDFKFGANRTGTVDMLKQDRRFSVLQAAQQQDASGAVFSSTLIRQYLRDGMVATAGAVMGHPFEIHGHIVPGNALGRKLGFPTANIKFAQHLIRPRYGVYAVRIALKNPDGTPPIWHDAICNIGVRPTVDGIQEVLEVHIFNFSDNIYDKTVRIAFIEHIRYEQKFNNIDDLKAQIAQDCNVAQRIHNLRISKT